MSKKQMTASAIFPAVRVWAVAGAVAVLACAAAPAAAAAPAGKKAVQRVKPAPATSGGSSGPFSVQWMIRAPLRP